MEGGLQEEPVEYGVSMLTSHSLNRRHPLGQAQYPLKCLHHVLLL